MEFKTEKDSNIMTAFSLSVSESKRLIAKGIAIHPLVRRKLKSGMIIITRGSTNTYIAEELVNFQYPHGQFVTGNISNDTVSMYGDKTPEVVIIDGRQTEMPFREALEKLKEGDIVFKGGNLLDYNNKKAAVTIAATDGGTFGRIQPYTANAPGHLVVPIGLEKEIHGNLEDYERILSQDIHREGFVPKLAVHENGEIFTEIEAIQLFGDVKVVPFAAGGIAGSEGSISFVICGKPEEIEKVMTVINKVKGEPKFI